MDFFEAQARAKKRTSRLVALFSLAVLGTIAAGYFGAVFLSRQIAESDYRPRSSRYSERSQLSAFRSQLSPSASLWQPRLFALVTLGTLAVVGLASLYKWHQFSGGGSAVAESVGGRRVDPHTTNLAERRLLNVVEEMALASGVPMPGVYVLDDEPAINAFAAGLTTADAVVAVTRGTLEKLTRDELQGVVAHEFSHILNGDMRLNLRLTSLIFGILVLGLIGRGILSSLGRARVTSSRNSKNSGGILVAIGAAGLGLLVIGYVGYFFGRLIQAAAVQFTRNPTGIGGALKKIAGYAMGSALASQKSAAIGHFFFAQGFRSMFGGLWATHPPVEERIRAVEPGFDGKVFDPPKIVDVNYDTWSQVRGIAAQSSKSRIDSVSPVSNPKFFPPGPLNLALLDDAHSLHASLPPRLLAAAHSPVQAPVLLYGLLLSDDESVQRRQISLIASRAGGEALHLLENLDAPLRSLGPEQKLPLLQLALPALKTLRPTVLAPFFELLDELVHADSSVSPFEFALQKLLLRNVAATRAPATAITQIYSFQAVAPEIATVLSVLAHASPGDTAAAFAAGAAQLKLLDGRLDAPAASIDLAALDLALDKLATASAPIKQRLLVAATAVVTANGEVNVEEYELLRAIAATLDIPLPPLPQ
ncbi:MAG: M48 family metallopeptidase [Verrucomicrobia bacterium]|nr:M48 family metallopeptidase [Verrucomicrobiota bacterium]